ncbi:hypothetical protein BST38_10320 [Mycolicibacterium parafortuitum]|nr:hypothetical protein BST38_10320 [Mycolicibacterium parafortuitum]
MWRACQLDAFFAGAFFAGDFFAGAFLAAAFFAGAFFAAAFLAGAFLAGAELTAAFAGVVSTAGARAGRCSSPAGLSPKCRETTACPTPMAAATGHSIAPSATSPPSTP